MRLQNKVALITGAASGFGHELARRFSAEGAALTLFDVDEAGCKAVAEEINGKGGKAIAVAGSVADAAAVEACFAASKEIHGRLDFLLNNAGIGGRMRLIERMSEADFDEVFDVNMKGVFLCARAAIPQIAEAGGGCIVNTASTAAFKPRPYTTAYTASKAAVAAFTKALAVELGPKQIRVNALLPVAADTAFLDKSMGDKKAEAIPQIEKGIPLGRLCDVTDYSSAALFLCSQEASFLTGVLLNVDGGWLSY